MKIRIKPHDTWFRLTLHLPLGLLKSRLSARIIAEAMNENCTSKQVSEVQETLKSTYRFIKDYIKKNGHFYLVDVESHDGDRVYVRV